ncbi:M48 family metallopeptidase [Desulfonema magnum]|uniref:Peptidase, M48 family n=1 Tax=Desulfonema magnum TaxID=45655 RepID=A0A975BU87_9BACT|nr:M48 family metallopeptidase [Desulfonema magnum]QTA91733.1 Peptidase, M48 family [Desulfonema magnum]
MNPRDQNKQYDGGVFCKAFSKGKAFGKMTVTSHSLGFQTQDFETTLPLQGLVIKAGGAGGRSLFFTHASVPDRTLHTGDHSILNDMNLMSYPGAARQIRQIHSAKKRSEVVLIVFVVFCLACIYGLFQLKEPLVTATAKRVPVTWEQKIGDLTLSQLKAGKHFIKDPEVLDMFKQLTVPLLSQIPDNRHIFTVHILEDPAINAFALPGGHIVVHTGLLLFAKSPEEVVGVLAHEAAHVTLQHGLRQLISSAGIYALAQAFFGNAEGLLAVIADNGTFLLTQKYSRDYEREADDKGWSYLVNANISPRGMIGFFNSLLEKQKKDASKTFMSVDNTLNFLSTHPTTKERIEHLQEKWKKLDQESEFMCFNLNFQIFQNAITEK